MDRNLIARVAKQAWFHRFPRGVPLALFALMSGVTALSVYAIEQSDDERRRLELDNAATEIAAALQRRSSANMAYLRAAAALFAAPDAREFSIFASFVHDLHLDANYRGAQGIGWAVALDRNAAVRAAIMPPEGAAPGFRVWPLPTGQQTLAVPVTYLQPLDRANRRAIGYNMYSEGVRRAAMDEAVRTGRPIASGRVVLVQEDGNEPQAGFLVYMPVFDRSPAGTKQLRGFVYSPFRAQDFLHSATNLSQVRDVAVNVYDGKPEARSLMAALPSANPGGLSLDKPVTIGARLWTLRVTAPRSHTLSQLSRATLLFGSVLALLLLAIARLITKRAEEDRQVLDWQTRQAAIRNSLTRELNHRVKNTLANVLSIIALTRRRTTGLEDFVESLTGRVRALSATHDLLTRSEWGATPLGAVIDAELAPYRDTRDNHVVMAGPDIDLAPNDALSLGLAIHELATNAAKYGALSATEGIVRILWEKDGADLARITWREEGGPMVVAPETRGFGRDLIEKIVAHELKSAVDLRFDPSGVVCVLTVPVRGHRDFQLRTTTPFHPTD